MVTNEERKKIAKRLRNFRWDVFAKNDSDFRKVLDKLIDIDYYDKHTGILYSRRPTWKRLADLIEPEPEQTCQIDTSKYKNGGTVNCGACGKRIPTKSRNTETVEAKYPRCPWCGVKVQS